MTIWESNCLDILVLVVILMYSNAWNGWICLISTVGLVVCGASLDQCTKILLQVCIKCVCANIHSRKHVKWRGWDTSVFVQVAFVLTETGV